MQMRRPRLQQGINRALLCVLSAAGMASTRVEANWVQGQRVCSALAASIPAECASAATAPAPPSPTAAGAPTLTHNVQTRLTTW